MSSFSMPITVDVHDVDFNGVCRPSSLLRYIQSSAQMQLNEQGMTYNELYDKHHRAFLLSRITVEFYEEVREGDALVAETFPAPSRGYTFLRCYQLWRDEKIIGRAISAWALIDTEEHSLVKTTDFDLPLDHLPRLDLELLHIRVPAEAVAVGEYIVSYCETDQNKHMNNTRYADMYAHFLPMENKRMVSLTINYLKEAPMGTNLKVLYAEKDGAHYFRTILPNGSINSEARIVLCELN
ncbi:MAG: hypothetical protein IKC72_07475 [Clostridia bacterium]|nr:hypothetical protein [Clostridia bacterium]